MYLQIIVTLQYVEHKFEFAHGIVLHMYYERHSPQLTSKNNAMYTHTCTLILKSNTKIVVRLQCICIIDQSPFVDSVGRSR